jgi:methionyl-tRNA formyltransferase
LRIAVAATPEVAIPSLDALLASKHELLSVITQPDRPSGRGQSLNESAISRWGNENGIEVNKPERDGNFQPLLSNIDLLITIGYGIILPKQVFELPRHGSLNLHFSLLPRWRGAAPVQRAIEAGDLVSGVTVFLLDEGMDTGPIYTQHRFALDTDITSDELFIELAELGAEALLHTLDLIESGMKPSPQPDHSATRAFKLSKEEAGIDWSQSADVISNKVRAFTSQPGAFTFFRGLMIKIDTPIVREMKLDPGVLLIENKKLHVGTATTALEIGYITPSGKSRMPSSEWANGARLIAGDLFG